MKLTVPTVAPAVRRALTASMLAALHDLRDDYDQAALAAIVAAGGPRAGAAAVDSARIQRALTAALAGLVGVYQAEASAQAADLGVIPDFRAGHTWTIERASMLTAATTAALYALAADLTRRRVNPWTSAGLIRRTVGLTRPQALAVERIQLSAPGRYAAARADTAANRYLADRARTIGVTEPHAALVAGAVDTWRAGLPGDEHILVWNGGTCPQCEPYDGATASLDDGFDDGLPPLHPACQCTVDCVPVDVAEEAA